MEQVFTLDQAFENLNTIIAHITIELDQKIKGEYIVDGWKQIKCIKLALVEITYLKRRQYTKKILPLEARLKYLEEAFIFDVERSLAINDCKMSNQLLVQYPTMTKYKRDQAIDTMTHLKEQLQLILEKNTIKFADAQWRPAYLECQEVITNITKFLQAKSESEIMKSISQMQNMLQTIRVDKRLNDEEEEELLITIEKIEEIRILQANINLHVGEQGSEINGVEQNISNTNNNGKQALQEISQANEFVKLRRRTKIKLFFTGIFTVIGSLGGKLGALFGAGVGNTVGNKAANKLIKSQSTA